MESTNYNSVNLNKSFDKTTQIYKSSYTAIMNHIKNVLRPKIVEANETVDIPVMYGNEERWATVRKRGVMRDTNGSLILPLIMLRRTSIERNTEILQNFEHDVKREHAQVVRNTTWSKKNRKCT